MTYDNKITFRSCQFFKNQKQNYKKKAKLCSIKVIQKRYQILKI